MGLNTELLHPKSGGKYDKGATLPPISMVNAYVYESAEQLERVFLNRAPGFAYTRIGNPTVGAFETRVNELEGGVGAVSCSSGMSAVALALLNVLQAGDEVIAASGLFGGTLDLFRDLQDYGIKVIYAGRMTTELLEPLITEKTKAVFAEVIENPGLFVMDIRRIADFLHERGIPLIVDSTTATPVLVKPLQYGADIVVHSTSKYINGSSNSIGGVIVDGGSFRFTPDRYPGFAEYKKYGKFAYTVRLRNTLWRNMGNCVSPMNAYLNVVGLETLGLRMERCCRNADDLAHALVQEEGVTVNYPTLAGKQQEELLARQMNGFGGAILTLTLPTKAEAYRVIDALKYAGIATNLGDVRTLVIHPSSTIYLHSDEEAKAAAGVTEGTIRVSVGIEDAEDLAADFRAAIRGV